MYPLRTFVKCPIAHSPAKSRQSPTSKPGPASIGTEEIIETTSHHARAFFCTVSSRDRTRCPHLTIDPEVETEISRPRLFGVSAQIYGVEFRAEDGYSE